MARKKRKRRRRPPQRAGAAAGRTAGPVPGGTGQSSSGSETAAPGTERVPATADRPAAARPRRDGPPEAPWGSFPLSELVILLALILLLAGFFVEPPRGAVMIGAGLVLGSLAGLELAAREHFSGYRSHTLLIAGAAGMATLAGTFALTGIHPAICLAAGAAVFGIAAWALAGAFRRRSGGALFRISS